MVLLTLSRKVNQLLGPFLLQQGIRARFRLGRGVIRDNVLLDSLLLLPVAKKLISLEVDDFQDSLRQSLIPNNRWQDVRFWQFQPRVVQWARREHLLALHRQELQLALQAFPELRQSPQITESFITKLLAPSQHDGSSPKLPKSSVVERALDMKQWADTKDTKAASMEMERIAKRLGGRVLEAYGGGLRVADIPVDADLSDTSLTDILEVAGGHVANCGPFHALCEQADIYQLWTAEYVEKIGRYLQRRARGDTIVLDVGSGDGLLALCLREYLDGTAQPSTTPLRRGRSITPTMRRSNNLTVIATDDGSWSISQKAEVEKLSVEDALDTYASGDQQLIVICSWMPMNEDWTAMFRKAKVVEYILIGECDDGMCGDNWMTWGNHAYLDDPVEALEQSRKGKPKNRVKIPTPYQLDGYERKDLEDLAPFQFSRFDSKYSKSGRTVSFRRIG